MKVFSLDGESDGLYGKLFAAAAIVYDDNGVEIDGFVGRIPDDLVENDWCRENVLPVIQDIQVTHPDSDALEEALWAFWRKWAVQGAVPLAHCASPVESGFFRRSVERRYAAAEAADLVVSVLGDEDGGAAAAAIEARRIANEATWQGPYPAIIEVATALLLAGADPASVAAYADEYGVQKPSGSEHHPGYDAELAYRVWVHVRDRITVVI